MRWLRFNCILMASLSILSATEAETSRNKRDLSYVKNFIKTAIFGKENKTKSELVLVQSGENYKIFRIPGFKNVLVKAVPKVTGADAVPDKVDLVLPENSKVGIVASYLGTKTQSETLDALQGVKTLLGSGILTATKDQAVPIDALPSHLQLIGVGDGTFEKPHILLDTSTVCDEVQLDEKPVVVQQPTIMQGHPFLSIFHRPIPFPTIVKPVKVPVPALPTKYSYKQLHGDGKVTTYTANEDQNVIVTQSNQPEPLPPIVTYRIQEVMKLGAHGMQGLATIPVFVENIQRPSVQYFTSPKVIPDRPVLSPVENNFSYKQIHNDGTVTSYSSDQKSGKVVVTEGGKVPTIPTFITNRIERVAATAGTMKQLNPVFLFGLNTAQTQWYNPLVYGHHMVDTKGGVRVNVDTMVGQQQTQQNQHSDIGSQGTYSYHTIHKDGSVTKHGDSSVSSKPAKPEIKPIPPLFIEDRLQTKTSSGSFSYKIFHNNGSVTNYGVFGVHEGNNGESKIKPIYKTTTANNKPDNLISRNKDKDNQPQIKDKSTAGYSYKRIHKDGSVTSYSNSGVVEDIEKRPVNQFRGDDLQVTNNGNIHINLNNKPKAGMILHDTGVQVSSEVNYVKNPNNSGDSKSNELAFHQYSLQAPLIGNPSPASYTYKTVHSDGSVTIYSQNGVKEINEQQKFIDQNNLQHSVSAVGTSEQEKVQENTRNNAGVIFNTQDLKQNGQVITQNNADSGTFSYTTIHNDGSATIFSQNGVKEGNLLFKNTQSTSATDVNQKVNNQNVHVSGQNIVVPVSGSFSYKAVHNDGLTTTYSQNEVKEENELIKNTQPMSAADVNQQRNNQNDHMSGQNIVFSDSGLSSYKAGRNDGSMTTQSGAKEENYANESHMKENDINQNLQPVNDMKVNMNEQHLHTNQQSKGTSSPFLYKAVHSDGSETNYSGQGVEEIKATSHNYPINTPNEQYSVDKNDEVTTENNIHTNSQYSGNPFGSFSHKTNHSDGSISNMQIGTSQQNVENRDQSFTQLEDEHNTNKVIPPPPKLPELTGNGLSVTPVGVLIADSNKVLFTKPVVSSYTYKQINHNSPDQFEVAVNVGEAVSTNSQFKVSGQIAEGANNAAATVDIIPHDYVYIPPQNVNEPLPIKSSVPNVQRDETSTEKQNPPSVVVLASEEVVPCVEKSLSEHPIVVLDEPMMYSYQQRKADGAAIHVESDQSVVSVNISPKGRVKNRGDIPESP